MFNRDSPAGNWLYPLISAIALLVLTSAAVYALTNLWRENTEGLGAEPATPAPDPSPTPAPSPGAPTPHAESPAEILDRRLALGEITIAEYEKLVEVLARRHAAPGAAAATSGAPVTNGTVAATL